MKKRSLKLVVSLILAMTMIMGMSMTAFAEAPSFPTMSEHSGCTHEEDNHFYSTGNTCTISGGSTCVEGRFFIAGGSSYDYYEGCETTSSYSTRPSTYYNGDYSAGWYYKDTEDLKFHQCGDPVHTHTPVDGWKVTDCGTYHYKSCSGCSEMLESAEHTFGSDGKCTVCGYSKAGSSSSSNSSSSKPAEPAKTDLEVREELEESMPVSPVSVDATQFSKADVTVIPGGTYNLSNFVTTRGIVKGINAAVAASNKTGSNTVTIYSGRSFSFNGEILKAIQAGKKDVTYFFNHNGHLYSVTIPATVDATKVLEKVGFAGPLYVGAQLGTTRLVK